MNISDLEQGLHWVVSLVVIAYGGTGRWFAFVMNDFFFGSVCGLTYCLPDRVNNLVHVGTL